MYNIMDLEKFITLYEELEKSTPNQLHWIYSQLDILIKNYNKKFQKNISVKFDDE